MPPLQLALVFDKVGKKRQELKILKSGVKSHFENNPRYQQIVEQIKTLQEAKKSIENQVGAAELSSDLNKIDLLKLDLKSDKESLCDAALALHAKGKAVEVVDQNNIRWIPTFSVRFKKAEDQPEPKSDAVVIKKGDHAITK